MQATGLHCICVTSQQRELRQSPSGQCTSLKQIDIILRHLRKVATNSRHDENAKYIAGAVDHQRHRRAIQLYESLIVSFPFGD